MPEPHLPYILFTVVSQEAFVRRAGGLLYFDAIFWQDLDVITPHLARDIRQNVKPIIQINAKQVIGEGLTYHTLHLN